ncbi:MAG: NAD(P)H-quinone oxidoreductase [SAR86 cluster bacterium]|nr:NAD(P)H-quinone oxidoreductase [SAR86 cluster bacterium]MCS5548667.1 NAD(P)H-quinone oxidoreductase [SAR86 cluster bacterium]GIS74553.1 MAG: NAD(P)H quinone oxidoreductase [Gammaproteobacteria bacterium]
MKAISQEGDDLLWKENPDPDLKKDEVLISIKASAINRADLLQRSGNYPVPPGASPILGLECSGIVEEVGGQVENLIKGDEVCALLAGGGYAEKVSVPSGQVLKVPKGFSFEQAAALPEVFATAYFNLYMEANLSEGEKTLIHAGASGVGTAAIQICKAKGNPCFVTAGTKEKISRCMELGAEGGTVRNEENFADAVAKWTDNNGVQVILDPVGANYLEDNMKSLTLEGRLVMIGLMGGAKTSINLGLLMMKRLRIIGSTLRAQPIPKKTEIMNNLNENIWPLLESGDIKPIIDTVIPIEEVDKAHELMESNQTFGKVILKVN